MQVTLPDPRIRGCHAKAGSLRVINESGTGAAGTKLDCPVSLYQSMPLTAPRLQPFLRGEFANIVRLFLQNNGTRQVYVPTNDWYTKTTVADRRVRGDGRVSAPGEVSG
jgi:hypothetical protein